ncbi:MAG: aminotransferase class V-fold PLP-dependent enzyme, partial [Clostridia bacterium]|nr:aminotransferase class V-fold PLP-dependent enzyme [Clostridia bacterium]
MIYLDNAATTLRKPQAVSDAVLQAMGSMGNCARGAHSSALSAARVIFEARSQLAAFFGCRRPDHVIFTANATEALNIAISGLFAPGDHIISTDLEHNSVLRPLYRLESEQNVSLSFVPADRTGCVDYADFERLIRPETKAIVCTHASNLTGNVLDLGIISALCKKHHLLLIVDASQTAGCLPIDMSALGIDVLCFTGHKGLMGPQGTGGLCIREGIKIRPWKVGGSGVLSHSRTQPSEYPTRLEAGTLNAHGIAGLLAAVR